MTQQLHFKVGNHHEPLAYDSETFDGCFSFQAVWPFFKKVELDAHAQEMFRVLKPVARYACSEYLLTPFFDWDNPEHVSLHKLYLSTLAGHPVDVPSRCRSGLAQRRLQDSGLCAFEDRSLAAVRAEA
jgi:hypothetical protein